MSQVTPPVNHELSATHEHEIRCAKLKRLQAVGREPWPEFKPVSHTCDQLRSFDMPAQQGEKTSEHFAISGRVITRREHGKTMFLVVQDRTGHIQLYVKKDTIGEKNFAELMELVDLGDLIWVFGPLFVTKMGELTLDVQEWHIVSKCLHPLPEKYHGLSNVEQRYRQRYLDLISNRDVFDKFVVRSNALREIRTFLQGHGFLEVETPMLHPIPGGAAARPFTTHHNAYDSTFYLRIAPELYLKRLVIGGMERVFEINRNFRNEGVSTRHNPEFTMIEFYMAHGDYRDGMSMAEQLIANAVTKATGSTVVQYGDHQIDFKAPFAQYSMKDSLVKLGGLNAADIESTTIDAFIKKSNVELANASASYGEKIFALFEAFVEKKIIQPTFITDYPIEVSPLAKRAPHNPEITSRFELFCAAMELANGFTELNDPFDQAERFRQQASARAGGDAEAHHYDADFINALEYGMPPTVGVGIGIDRLIMLITNTTSIKDVILFPTLKNKLEE